MPSRSIALDFLRAVAVLMVIARHLPELPGNGFIACAFNVIRQGGWIGVDLFFVLSGYLVSGLLIKEWEKTGAFDPLRFLVRRGLKIYPAFYCMILATTAMFLIKPGYVHWQAVLAEVLFVQNYFPGLWNHTWSLAVEEHFYLVLVVSMMIAVRTKFRPTTLFCVGAAGVILLCLSMRIRMENVPFQLETHLFPTHLRIDSLSFGVLLRAAMNKKISIKNVFLRLLLIFVALALSCWAFAVPLGSQRWVTSYGLTALSVASVFLIVALSNWPKLESNTAMRYVANLGSYSYSIYLWHMLLTHVFNAAAKRAWPNLSPELNSLFCVLWVLVGAIVLAKLIEIPALRFRDRVYPSLSGSNSTPLQSSSSS